MQTRQKTKLLNQQAPETPSGQSERPQARNNDEHVIETKNSSTSTDDDYFTRDLRHKNNARSLKDSEPVKDAMNPLKRSMTKIVTASKQQVACGGGVKADSPSSSEDEVPEKRRRLSVRLEKLDVSQGKGPGCNGNKDTDTESEDIVNRKQRLSRAFYKPSSERISKRTNNKCKRIFQTQLYPPLNTSPNNFSKIIREYIENYNVMFENIQQQLSPIEWGESVKAGRHYADTIDHLLPGHKQENLCVLTLDSLVGENDEMNDSEDESVQKTEDKPDTTSNSKEGFFGYIKRKTADGLAQFIFGSKDKVNESVPNGENLVAVDSSIDGESQSEFPASEYSQRSSVSTVDSVEDLSSRRSRLSTKKYTKNKRLTVVSCPLCNQIFNSNEIEAHAASCFDDLQEEEVIEVLSRGSSSLVLDNERLYKCEKCNQKIVYEYRQRHFEECRYITKTKTKKDIDSQSSNGDKFRFKPINESSESEFNLE